MVHGHPVKYRAKNLAGACHGFLRKFLELIVHRTAEPAVRIELSPAESRTNFRLSEGGDDPADADLLEQLDPQFRSSVSRPREFRDIEFHEVCHRLRPFERRLILGVRRVDRQRQLPTMWSGNGVVLSS